MQESLLAAPDEDALPTVVKDLLERRQVAGRVGGGEVWIGAGASVAQAQGLTAERDQV